jgi:hypothetical protein
MSEHSGVTGKTPHQVARADSRGEITDAKLVRGGIIDRRSRLRPHCRAQPNGHAVGTGARFNVRRAGENPVLD